MYFRFNFGLLLLFVLALCPLRSFSTVINGMPEEDMWTYFQDVKALYSDLETNKYSDYLSTALVGESNFYLEIEPCFTDIVNAKDIAVAEKTRLLKRLHHEIQTIQRSYVKIPSTRPSFSREETEKILGLREKIDLLLRAIATAIQNFESTMHGAPAQTSGRVRAMTASLTTAPVAESTLKAASSSSSKRASVFARAGFIEPSDAPSRYASTRIIKKTLKTNAMNVAITGGILEIIDSEKNPVYGGIKALHGQQVLHLRITGNEDLEGMPRHFVAVLDVSGSMSGGRLDRSKLAINTVLDHFATLAKPQLFSLVQFSDTARLTITKTLVTSSNVEALKSIVNSMWASGGTSIWEGIQSGLTALAPSTTFPDIKGGTMLFLTDGEDSYTTIGRLMSSPTISRLRERGNNCFVLGLGSDLSHNFLRDLAQLGRGSFFPLLDPVAAASSSTSIAPVNDGKDIEKLWALLAANAASTVASEVSVTVSLKDNFRIHRVIPEQAPHQFDEANQQVTIRFPSLAQGEVKDVYLLMDKTDTVFVTLNHDDMMGIGPTDHVDISVNQTIKLNTIGLSTLTNAEAARILWERIQKLSTMKEIEDVLADFLKENITKEFKAGLEQLLAQIRALPQIASMVKPAKMLVQALVDAHQQQRASHLAGTEKYCTEAQSSLLDRIIQGVTAVKKDLTKKAVRGFGALAAEFKTMRIPKND